MTREVSELGAVKRYGVETVMPKDDRAPYGTMMPSEYGAYVMLHDYDALRQRADRLAERLERAREYMEHKWECDYSRNPDVGGCTCGLTAFLDSMAGDKP